MLPAHCLVKAGELAPKTILCSAVLATVHMWVGKWQKSTVVEKIVKQFSETDVYDALKLLCDVCGREDPKKRQDSNKRPKGEAFANDIHDTVLELDNSNKLPEIVVASFQVKFCPVETVSDSDPGVSGEDGAPRECISRDGEEACCCTDCTAGSTLPASCNFCQAGCCQCHSCQAGCFQCLCCRKEWRCWRVWPGHGESPQPVQGWEAGARRSRQGAVGEPP